VTDLAPGNAPSASRGVTVTLLGVTQILAWGSSYYLPAVVAGAIARDTGWSLTWVVGGLSLGLVAAGLVSPEVGRRIGQGFGRTVLAASAMLLASGLLCVGLATTLPVYLAGWIVIGAGMGAGLYDAAFATLGTLYGLEARRTITVLTLFGGFASTVCWPLSAYLLEHLGWRGTCFAYAAIQLGFSLPAYLLLLPSPAPALSAASLPSEAKQPTSRLIEPRQLPCFLLLGLTISLAALISTTLSVHLLTLLQADGTGLSTAVMLGAMVGPAQVSARVVEMILGRHYHPIWTKLAATSLVTVGIVLIWTGMPLRTIGLLFYGCGIGIESIARGALPLALFGAAGYGARMGQLAFPSLIAMAAAPYLGAVLMQQGGADLTFSILTALAAMNVALVLMLRAVSKVGVGAE
jgi:hypothetical protein